MKSRDKKLKIFDIIKTDWQRYNRNSLRGGYLPKMLFYALSGKNPSFAFVFWLRIAGSNSPLKYLAIIKWKLMSRKYGLDISYNCKIGPGLYLGHAKGIVINSRTIIGSNFSISHFNSIGSDNRKYAVIGDNVYVGPNSCIVNGVKIGNNVKIGAGAVVVKDIPDNCTAVGNPARIIQH